MQSSLKTLSHIINPCTLVRKTCQRVYEKMSKLPSPDQRSVTINQEKITSFIEYLEEKISKEGLAYEKWAKYHLDPNEFSFEQVLAYVFVVDGMNFCFWPNNPSGNYEYEHMTKNLAKILKEQPEFFSCQYLQKVTSQELKERVFNDMEFALLSERARILNEIGYVIESNYDSSFQKFIESSQYDVPTLILKIVQSFSGFRDEAIYDGEQIFFYKRAQILVADLYGALQEKQNLEQPIIFNNLEEMTMFADYRVPQILRHVGIFEYSQDLSQKIDQEIELPYSSRDEVEIRALTVVAVEQILDKIKTIQNLKDKIQYSFEVDWLLWQMGENSLSEMKPHHKVHSIFY